MPFLKIPYRDYPKEGLFKKLYRENIYKIEEFKDEFKYKIIDSISNGIRNDDIPVNIEEFIINIPAAENITHALNLLKKDELIILKKHLEKILFGNSSNLIQQIGEHSLFRSIEYLEKLINNS